MPKTLIEKSISHKRHRSGILVPIIEDRLKWPVRVETSKDVKFLKDLFEKNQQRELDRDSERLYSPSALSECLRRVFLNKNFENLEVPRVFPPRIEPNFYFLTGEFLHLKWQYTLYKIAQEFPEVELAPDPIDSFEVRVISKRGDHGGTADVVPAIDGVHYVVDFKGLNVRTFNQISRGTVPGNYRIQTTDYMILLNSERPRRYHVEDALLVCENKGGPTTHFPAALCESRISLKENKAEVRGRLELLRKYEADEEIPPIECVTTTGIQFKGCPFQKFCKEEVKQEEQRRFESRNTNGYKVSVPKKRRTNRSR
jgi:hypothetical protein